MNPTTPIYAKPAPIPNKNCINCGGIKDLMYPPLVAEGGGGKAVELEEGYSIDIQDKSDTSTYRFKIDYDPQVALSAALSVSAKVLGTLRAQPVLLGLIVDEIILNWAYNIAIDNQHLTGVVQSPDPSVDFPDLNSGVRTVDLEDVSITKDASFTIHGDSGNGTPGSTAAATANLIFGNYVAWGDGDDRIGSALSGLQAFFDTLSKQIQTNRNHTLTTTGGANKYFFYFVPVRFGEVIFTKGIFVGGYRRLKNVAGTLKAVLDDGDIESPISLDNGTGYTENFYVYQSEYDNKNDTVTPTYAS